MVPVYCPTDTENDWVAVVALKIRLVVPEPPSPGPRRGPGSCCSGMGYVGAILDRPQRSPRPLTLPRSSPLASRRGAPRRAGGHRHAPRSQQGYERRGSNETTSIHGIPSRTCCGRRHREMRCVQRPLLGERAHPYASSKRATRAAGRRMVVHEMRVKCARGSYRPPPVERNSLVRFRVFFSPPITTTSSSIRTPPSAPQLVHEPPVYAARRRVPPARRGASNAGSMK